MGRALSRLLGTALACAASLATATGYEMKSYVTVNGKVQEAFAWCDAPDRFIAITRPAHAEPERPQPVKLRQVLKRPAPNTDAFDYVAQYLLGMSEGAAGSVYNAILLPGSTPRSGTASQYFLRRSNVENAANPTYRMSRVSELRTPEGDFRCRYVPQAAFMGVTARRTVIVWDNGKTATYATRNFDGTPGVYVTGGKRVAPGIEGGIHYEFPVQGGVTYFVNIDPNGPLTGAEVIVRKDGRLNPSERFLAYSVSVPRK